MALGSLNGQTPAPWQQPNTANNDRTVIWAWAGRLLFYSPTRKQNLQANSRSACQFWHKREKEAERLFAKLGIPSLLQGVEIKLIFALLCTMCLWTAVSEILADFFFKFPYLGMKSRNWRNVPKFAYVLSFYPRGSKISLFSLYRQPFSRYETIFKISIFWHLILNLKKGPKVAYVLSFYPKGRN